MISLKKTFLAFFLVYNVTINASNNKAQSNSILTQALHESKHEIKQIQSQQNISFTKKLTAALYQSELAARVNKNKIPRAHKDK